MRAVRAAGARLAVCWRPGGVHFEDGDGSRPVDLIAWRMLKHLAALQVALQRCAAPHKVQIKSVRGEVDKVRDFSDEDSGVGCIQNGSGEDGGGQRAVQLGVPAGSMREGSCGIATWSRGGRRQRIQAQMCRHGLSAARGVLLSVLAILWGRENAGIRHGDGWMRRCSK